MRRKPIVCRYCNTKQKIKYIDAMVKAGFQVRHLPCRECGRNLNQ